MNTCPACGLKCNSDCEHGISIELHGECLWCRYGRGDGRGTEDERQQVYDEYDKRRCMPVYVDPSKYGK